MILRKYLSLFLQYFALLFKVVITYRQKNITIFTSVNKFEFQLNRLFELSLHSVT